MQAYDVLIFFFALSHLKEAGIHSYSLTYKILSIQETENMWRNDRPILVQRSPTEMLIDDLEYESRRFEAKLDRAIERESHRLENTLTDLVLSIFSGLGRRR